MNDGANAKTQIQPSNKKGEGYLENSLEDAMTCRQRKMEENTS